MAALAALPAAALEASRPVRSDPAVEAEVEACTDHRPAQQEANPAKTAR